MVRPGMSQKESAWPCGVLCRKVRPKLYWRDSGFHPTEKVIGRSLGLIAIEVE